MLRFLFSFFVIILFFNICMKLFPDEVIMYKRLFCRITQKISSVSDRNKDYVDRYIYRKKDINTLLRLPFFLKRTVQGNLVEFQFLKEDVRCPIKSRFYSLKDEIISNINNYSYYQATYRAVYKEYSVSILNKLNFTGRNTDREAYEKLEIKRKGEIVYAVKGHSYYSGVLHDQDDYCTNPFPMGMDITGDGKPNLVMSEWTGGNKGDYVLHIFEISEKFKLIDKLSFPCRRLELKDINKDGTYDIKAVDPVFEYWYCDGASSPYPTVILSCKNGKYSLNKDLMKKSPPSYKELHKKAMEMKKIVIKCSKNERCLIPIPVELWAYMLDLIYTGNSESAWKFYDMAVPDNIKIKKQFLKDFRKNLTGSKYWKDMKNYNTGDDLFE